MEIPNMGMIGTDIEIIADIVFDIVPCALSCLKVNVVV